MLWDSSTEMWNTFIILVGMFHCRLSLLAFLTSSVILIIRFNVTSWVIGLPHSFRFLHIPFTMEHTPWEASSPSVVKDYPALYGTPVHLPCSQDLPSVKWIQFPPLHPLYLKFILTSSCVPVVFQVLSSLSDFCMLRASPFSLFDSFSDRRWRVHMTKLPIRPVQFSSSFW